MAMAGRWAKDPKMGRILENSLEMLKIGDVGFEKLERSWISLDMFVGIV
jgi:hypothetical protein